MWGCALILYKVAKDYKMFFNKQTVILFLFVISNGITILLNYKHNLFQNIGSLAYVALGGILFLNQAYGKEKKQVEKELVTISKLNVYFPMLYAAIAIVLLIFDVSIIFETKEGIITAFGIYENRLWGLYNPNTAGAICLLSIFTSMYLFYKKAEKRWLLIVNIILEYLYLVLGQSRGAMYSFLVAMFIMVFFVYIGKEKFKEGNWGLRLKYIFLGSLTMIICVWMPSVVRTVTPYLVLGDEFNGEDEEIVFERVEGLDDDLSKASNGRFELWQAGWEVFQEHPVMGTGIENIYEYGKVLLPEKRALAMKGGLLHNIFFTTGVASGGVGFAIFISFLVLLFIRCMQALFVYENKTMRYLTVMVGALMMINLTENNIIYWNCVQGIIFWQVCSYLFYYHKEEK